MCHVSHLTDALLGMAALSLAVCATAGSSTGVVRFYTDAKSCLHSFPISLSRSIVVGMPQRIIMHNLQPYIRIISCWSNENLSFFLSIFEAIG